MKGLLQLSSSQQIGTADFKAASSTFTIGVVTHCKFNYQTQKILVIQGQTWHFRSTYFSKIVMEQDWNIQLEARDFEHNLLTEFDEFDNTGNMG